jgi:hypothetical protein
MARWQEGRGAQRELVNKGIDLEPTGEDERIERTKSPVRVLKTTN